MTYKKNQNSKSELMKYTVEYWTSKSKYKSLNLHGTIDPLADIIKPSINKSLSNK